MANLDEPAYMLAAGSSPRHEWWDEKQGLWVSREGYEVCQDHCGPRATCPYNHGKRRP